MKRNEISTHTLTWRNILFVLRERHNYLWPGQSHIEIYVVKPKRAAIPITETGYRSHFIITEELSLAGGTIAFVTDWLDREARTKRWQEIEYKSRQLDLF